MHPLFVSSPNQRKCQANASGVATVSETKELQKRDGPSWRENYHVSFGKSRRARGSPSSGPSRPVEAGARVSPAPISS
jgi:hypothetical protein